MRTSRSVALAALLTLVALAADAHQPVMDMAPRWVGGYGVQARYELQFSDKILDGDKKTSNPGNRERIVHTTWIEGIYTWKREARLTFKLPIVDQERDSRVDGSLVKQRGSGVGDLIVGVPLRKYWNFPGSTANIGLTPSLRVPTGATGASFPVGDGSTDFGLSISAIGENPFWYTLVDVFWWKNSNGKRGINQGDVLGLDFNLGIHPYHDNVRNLGAFVMVDLEARFEERGVDTGGTTGGTRTTLGPVLVGYWNNVMLRSEVKFPVYEKVLGTQFSRGAKFSIGIGVTF